MNESHVEINLREVAEIGYDLVFKALQNSQGHCIVIVPMETYYQHSDYAREYLELAFIGQRLSDICNNATLSFQSIKHRSVARFSLEYNDRRQLSDKICWLSCLYRDMDESDEEYVDVRETLYDFEDIIMGYEQDMAFPSLIDKYFANLIGSHYDWTEEHKDEILKLNPEWAFHTWKSTLSQKLGFDLYVSTTHWIIPSDADALQAIELCSDIDINYMSIEQVDEVISDLHNVTLFTGKDVISMSMSKHSEAIRVAEKLFPADEDPFENARYAWHSGGNFFLPNDRSFIKYEGYSFQYLLFPESFTVLNKFDIQKLTTNFQSVVGKLLDLSSMSFKMRCDWSLLNDELFEQLCYDLICRSGRFNPHMTKKMGHSRARDGGRDIVTWTIMRAGASTEKWIVQCKFSHKKKSLGRNDIMLSDLIDEYAPKGVIIITNTLIDSGTYDKYERIASNKAIRVEAWDGLHVERDVNCNPDLLKKYFESSLS